MSEYGPKFRRIEYEGGAIFVPVCRQCGRFVKADEEAYVNDLKKPNATCSKCGRTHMLFEGYYS